MPAYLARIFRTVSQVVELPVQGEDRQSAAEAAERLAASMPDHYWELVAIMDAPTVTSLRSAPEFESNTDTY